MISSPSTQQVPAWKPHPRGDARRISAIRIAKLVLAANGLEPEHRNELLSIAVWKYTESDGKFKTRFRSAGALHERDLKKLNHEHVIPRKWLRDEMLQAPAECEPIMGRAIGCVVTREEHLRLTSVSKQNPSLQGWARYVAAGVRVFDLEAGREIDLSDPDAEI